MKARTDGDRRDGSARDLFRVRPTRRGMLQGAAAGAAALGMAGKSQLWGQSPPPGVKSQFLLDRLTFGRTPEMATELRNRGWTGFLEWQLDAQSIDDSAADAAVAAENPDVGTLWGYSAHGLATDPSYATFPNFVQAQLPQSIILYGQHARRQLKWMMTAFLQNVHNTFLPQTNAYFFWGDFLRDVVHANALGSYPELVRASGQHGSMSLYLAQYLSKASNPIENYARELMELHTTGKDPFFTYVPPTETDVVEASKVLTGWSFVQGPANPSFGEFAFVQGNHAGGTKTVMGKTYPADQGAGVGEGLDLIEDLTHHELTALHIARRMILWFLGDDVFNRYYQAWVRTATALHLSGCDLKEGVRELFNEQYYAQIAPASHERVRRPLNLVIALKRATGAAINTQSLNPFKWLEQLYKMGQVPGWWPAPDGFPVENDAWTGSMQARIEFLHDAFLGDNGLLVPASALTSIFPASVPTTQYAQTANNHVFGGCLPATEVSAIQGYLTGGSPPAGDLRLWALFLTMSAPSYQYLCS